MVSFGETTIFVSDRKGAPPSVVLVHGNSSTHRLFDRLVAQPLLSERRVVAVDLPGHGQSDRPRVGLPGRYSLGYYAAAVAAVGEAVDVADAVFFGFSLGGHVLLEALALALLPRTRAVMVQGAPPLSSAAELGMAFQPLPEMSYALKGPLDESEVLDWGAVAFGPHVEMPEWFPIDVRETDPDARQALGASLLRGEISDEVAVFDQTSIPIAVVHAEDDRLVRLDAMRTLTNRSALWRGQVQVIERAGHYAPWERPDALAALLAELITDVTVM